MGIGATVPRSQHAFPEVGRGSYRGFTVRCVAPLADVLNHTNSSTGPSGHGKSLLARKCMSVSIALNLVSETVE